MMKKIESICVIDDDIVYQYLIRKEIELAGITEKVITFSDGKAAIYFFESMANENENTGIPDIIFLDINMPIMDGWQFLERYIPIKNRFRKNITIYMVSSSMSPVDVDKAKAINEISDYIVKPISRSNLLSISERFLQA